MPFLVTIATVTKNLSSEDKNQSTTACEQARLFGRAKNAREGERENENENERRTRERASGGLRRSLARSRETSFARRNSGACSQANQSTVQEELPVCTE